MMRLGALMLAAVMLLPSVASAHRSSTYDLGRSVSYIGEIDLWLINKYDKTTTYEVQVLDKDLKPIDDSKWSSRLTGDTVTLKTDELVDIRVRVKEKGKYYVCTIVAPDENPVGNIVFRSRVCLRLWYK